jgi:hypothetical protein
MKPVQTILLALPLFLACSAEAWAECGHRSVSVRTVAHRHAARPHRVATASHHVTHHVRIRKAAVVHPPKPAAPRFIPHLTPAALSGERIVQRPVACDLKEAGPLLSPLPPEFIERAYPDVPNGPDAPFRTLVFDQPEQPSHPGVVPKGFWTPVGTWGAESCGRGQDCRYPPPLSPPVAAVPEPETWSLFIIGLGFVGAMLRRARARRPAPLRGAG